MSLVRGRNSNSKPAHVLLTQPSRRADLADWSATNRAGRQAAASLETEIKLPSAGHG